MADLILAPICPKCHHIFENFSITIETEPIFKNFSTTMETEPIDKNSRFYYNRVCYSNTYCPQCKEPITGVQGQKFPPEDGCFEFNLKTKIL